MADPKDDRTPGESEGADPGFRYYVVEAKGPGRASELELVRQLVEYRNAATHGAVSDEGEVLVLDAVLPVEAVGIEIVPATPSAPAPVDPPRARRRPGVLEVALFCMPKAMREDFESFIGDLREQCAEKAAEGWPRPLLVVTAAAQVTIVLVVGLWKTGVLKTLGLLRLLGL